MDGMEAVGNPNDQRGSSLCRTAGSTPTADFSLDMTADLSDGEASEAQVTPCRDGHSQPGREPSGLRIRDGTATDLDGVNQVVESAVMTWGLPDRVKRLSLPTYRYGVQDLDHLHLKLVEQSDVGIVGIAALEPAAVPDSPPGMRCILLHGIYVASACHRRGIGRQLVEVAEAAAAHGGYDGVLVKAQPSAVGFFEALGFQKLAVRDVRRDYPHRLWKAC